jgi:hypothetical protein
MLRKGHARGLGALRRDRQQATATGREKHVGRRRETAAGKAALIMLMIGFIRGRRLPAIVVLGTEGPAGKRRRRILDRDPRRHPRGKNRLSHHDEDEEPGKRDQAVLPEHAGVLSRIPVPINITWRCRQGDVASG